MVPAQHYFMGGVWVDSDSHTSMGHLYAVGETSCNGVHGANRLASNSLLESLVFAKRAARKITGETMNQNMDQETDAQDRRKTANPDGITETETQAAKENVKKHVA